MEVLVVAIGELVALMVPMMIALVEAAVVVASAAVEAAALFTEFTVTGSLAAARASRAAKRRRQATATAEPTAGKATAQERSAFVSLLTSPAMARWSRRLTIASSVTLLVTLLAIVAVNMFFFAPVVRVALGAIEQHHGIVASFDHAEGNLFTGRVELRDAHFRRQGHRVSDFDLSADKLQVDADIWRLVMGQIAFDRVFAGEIRGQYVRTGQRDPQRLRRHYTIDRLAVDDVEVELIDRSRPPLELAAPVELESLSVDGFRSRWAAFDVLFRSTCTGRLAGQPLEISNGPAGDSHQTRWKIRDLPIDLVAAQLGRLFEWLVDGRLDVFVDTHWRPDDAEPELKSHCQLVFHDLKAEVPDALPPVAERAIIAPAIALLDQRGRELPLEFDLIMNQNAFEGKLSILAAGVLTAIGDEADRIIRQSFTGHRERIDAAVGQLRNRIRSMIGPRDRQPEVDEERQ